MSTIKSHKLSEYFDALHDGKDGRMRDQLILLPVGPDGVYRSLMVATHKQGAEFLSRLIAFAPEELLMKAANLGT